MARAESPLSDIRTSLEVIMTTLEPHFELCRIDVQAAILLAKGAGLCKSWKEIDIPGPLTIFHYGVNRRVRFDFHSVAQLDNRWVIDIAQIPGQRVYDGLPEYFKKAVFPY